MRKIQTVEGARCCVGVYAPKQGRKVASEVTLIQLGSLVAMLFSRRAWANRFSTVLVRMALLDTH